MKNFVKAMNQEEAAFNYLREISQTEANLKEGIFIFPQLRDLIKDQCFDKLIQGDEKAAWDGFKFVVKGFLWNRKFQNYEELVKNPLERYQNLGCKMSLKHTSFTRIWFFQPENCGAASEEHGERFYEDISSSEKRYQRKWKFGILADY